MSIKHRLAVLAATAAIASVSLVALPGSVAARDLDREGRCTGNTDWYLSLSIEGGRIEVEGEVDMDRNGVTWRWSMFNDGVRFAKGQATTKAPSGEFEVRRFSTNGPGPDRIVFRAKNPATGEICRAVATI
jgi:hypothetical protein